MRTTPTFDAIVEIAKCRDESQIKRDQSNEPSTWNWWNGYAAGLEYALAQLSKAGEKVASAEYIASHSKEKR